VTRTPLSRSKRQGHEAALLSAALTRKAAAAVNVGTYSAWESTATLRLLGGARRGRRGAGAYCVATRIACFIYYMSSRSVFIDSQAYARPFSVLLQNRVLALVLQISTDLDKILHTPIVVWNALVGRVRPRSARGRLQAKPERLFFFVILVTHPIYVICRDDGSPRFRRQTVKVEVRSEDGCYRDKFRKFVALAEPDPKQHVFAF